MCSLSIQSKYFRKQVLHSFCQFIFINWMENYQCRLCATAEWIQTVCMPCLNPVVAVTTYEKLDYLNTMETKLKWELSLELYYRGMHG